MIRLLSELGFGADGNAANHLGTGWSGGEAGFRWMIDEASELWLDAPDDPVDLILELSLRPFVRDAELPAQSLVISVRGVEVGRTILSGPCVLGWHIPAALLAEHGPLCVTLQHPDAARPSDFGGSTDGRRLSIAVRSARLLAVGAPAIQPAGGITTVPGGLAAAQRLPAVEPTDPTVDFESLGDNPEFALLQRMRGQESGGLFRFAGIRLADLLRNLREGCTGIGAPDNLKVVLDPQTQQYVARDDAHGITWFTFVDRAAGSPDALRAQLLRDLPELARGFCDVLRQGSRICVVKRNEALRLEEVLPLYAALNELGRCPLLFVVPADAAHPSGEVEVVLPGLLRGFIARFAPYGAPHALDEAAWLAVCRNAWRLAHGRVFAVAPPAATPLPAPSIAAHATPRPRRIVFVGNCQCNMLANVWRRLPRHGAADEVVAIASYAEASPEQRAVAASADIMVQQVLDFVPKTSDLPTAGRVLLVPHVTAAFLWPHTGQAHPRNAPAPIIDESGPYPAELGDSFLNRMLADGIAPEAALDRYRATDLAQTRRVDRLLELVLDRQRSRDQACGFAFADYIDARFRTENLFRTANHPERAMALHMAAEVFARLDIEPADIAQALADAPEQILPPSEMPLHPSVVAHFGLGYAPPERRYHYFNEGGFSFDEFALRYMRFEWNAPLAEGMHLLWRGDTAAGAAQLRTALPSAPRSAAGRMALANALEKLGELSEAVEYACQACDIEPDNERYAQRVMQISERAIRARSQATAG